MSMKISKAYSKQRSYPPVRDEELKFLLHFILALSRKQRRKLFIELSKYDFSPLR